MRTARPRMVLREHQTAVVAVAILDEQLKMNPSTLADHELRPTDFRRFRANLETTYFIRLFAEFESALRDIWSSTGRRTQPRTSDLIDSLASRNRVAPGVYKLVHETRKYRNALVHEEAADAGPVALADAIRHLLRFLSHMPADW